MLCEESVTTDGGVVMGSGAGPTELYPNGDESVDDVGRENVFVLNDTREALSHDGSEHNSVSEPKRFFFFCSFLGFRTDRSARTCGFFNQHQKPEHYESVTYGKTIRGLERSDTENRNNYVYPNP